MSYYRLHLVNELPSNQTLWCFLAMPQPRLTVPLYCTSTVFATLPPASRASSNVWTLSRRLQLLAFGSVSPFGPDWLPQSTVLAPFKEGQTWQAKFFQGPGMRLGPQLLLHKAAPHKGLYVQSNRFDLKKEAAYDWYNGLGLALHTPVGQLQQLWSPPPNWRHRVQSVPSFYVYKGPYHLGRPILYHHLVAQSQLVHPTDFDATGQSTVRLTSKGGFVVRAGPPS